MLAQRAKMYEEILKLQAQIRVKKERERNSKNAQGLQSTRLFEPITKAIEKLSKPHPTPQNVENLIDLNEEEEVDEFKEILKTIPVSNRDDGLFGLNVHTNRIEDNKFKAAGNTLTVNTEHGVKEYKINDPDLWRLLLVMRPSSIKLKARGKYKQFVYDYKRIADELDLIDYAFAKIGKNINKRVKYKLISNEKSGSGFLFSTQPPPFIIPSDKKGLLRELYKAVAELRAGNTSMQNLVVPLAQEAKRKKILPKNLLTVEEKNWVFS